MYAKDLRALTDEAYQQPCGGKARTMQEVTAEVAGYNMMVAGILAGQAPQMPSDDQRAAFTASLASREKGIEAVVSSSNMLADAILAAGDRLGTMTAAPWGEEMSLYQMANIAANHILYHDGQLNVVQSLHGDPAMHWFDDEPTAAG